jgi:hypothetical protein
MEVILIFIACWIASGEKADIDVRKGITLEYEESKLRLKAKDDTPMLQYKHDISL